MSYYLVKFQKKMRGTEREARKLMFEGSSIPAARIRADEVAQGAGGGKADLQLFNEFGLVATRTGEGVWSH